MSNLITLPNEITMDSREIAELTGKRHAHICRDIRTQLQELKINETIFGSVYKDKKGEDRRCFNLDYDQLMILVTGYSIPLRAKVIKRWTELEKKNTQSIPQSYPEALKLAYEQALQIEQQQEQLQLQAPKVALAEDCIRDKHKHYSITNAGKQLGLKQTFIFDLMIKKHLLTTEKLPTQHAINKKYLTLRTNTIGGKNYPQAVMTMENIFNFKKSYEKDFV